MTMLRRYKVGLKIRYVREITAETTRKDNPLSIRQACNDHMIDPKMFCQWRMLLSSLLEQHTKRAANKMHPGRPSSISKDHENILLEWIQTKREHGTPVDYSMLEQALGQLDEVF